MPIIYVKGADFSSAGLGKYPTNPLYYQDEMKAVLSTNALASLSTDPNAAKYKEALNTFITKLKVGGIWAKMDYLFMPWLAQSRTEMSLNLKTATKEAGLLIPSSGVGNVNFGFRHLSATVAQSNEDKQGIIMPYNYAYNYEDFHFAFYHNALGSIGNGDILKRDMITRVNGTLVANNNFANVNCDGTALSGRLGYNNDANRLTFPAFDNNQKTAPKKLIGINTMAVGANLEAAAYITGNSAAGERSAVTVPANYFTKTANTYMSILAGDTVQYRPNTCVISAGKGLTTVQWAAYRAACDAMDSALLGTIPTFQLY